MKHKTPTLRYNPHFVGECPI